MKQEKYNMFVGRIQAAGIKNSRPCLNCANSIIGNPAIGKVFWTTGETNTVVYCRPRELLSSGVVVSRGNLPAACECNSTEENNDIADDGEEAEKPQFQRA